MIINTPQDMLKLWEKIASKWNKKVLLYWELASGKTQFVKWFAQQLWTKKEHVQSPTYTYINEYDWKILHIDMYRLQEQNELIEKWILEKIEEYEYVCIEWPKFESLYIEDDFIKINFQKLSKNKRKISISQQ